MEGELPEQSSLPPIEPIQELVDTDDDNTTDGNAGNDGKDVETTQVGENSNVEKDFEGETPSLGEDNEVEKVDKARNEIGKETANSTVTEDINDEPNNDQIKT